MYSKTCYTTCTSEIQSTVLLLLPLLTCVEVPHQNHWAAPADVLQLGHQQRS
jgi:hypothetical protein